MAISFNELNLKVDDSVKTFNFHDQEIEVKQYLSVNEKLDLVSWIINQSVDDMKFYNVGKLTIFRTIGLVQHYTNINFSDEQLNNPVILYDQLVSSGLFEMINTLIPDTETYFIYETLMDTVEAIYKYQDSLLGILETVTTDYSNLNFDISELQKNISNPENLTLLKDIVTKLG